MTLKKEKEKRFARGLTLKRANREMKVKKDVSEEEDGRGRG